MITHNDVICAYRLFFEREPESESVISNWMSHANSLTELRNCFLASDEYRSQNNALTPSMSGLEGPFFAQGDYDLPEDQRLALFQRVKETWARLGEENPYWAVLSADEFQGLSPTGQVDKFYASGLGDVNLIKQTLARNNVCLPDNAIVVEYGCGLGRVTAHLAKEFYRVIGIDISKPMITAAENYIKSKRIHNTSFISLDCHSDVDALPECDLFFSFIVLQHSPPPIITMALRGAMKSLKSRGVALFQVPTYIPDYNFIAREYFSRYDSNVYCPPHKQYELHAVKQKDVFEIAKNSDCAVLEVIENAMLGPLGHGAMSNTFLVQKR